MIKQLLILISFTACHSAPSQPHIEGEVHIDMKLGLIQCDLTLSQLPDLKEYSILLNKGMNIKYFQNQKNKALNYSGHYNGKTQGEAIEYKSLDNKESLPSTFKVSYTGAFPVYVDQYNAFDYKGIIAFNGQTLRATEQTKWYPVIYDVANDRLINSYIYNLKITITNGNTIFINGSPPKKAKTSYFESKKPYPLLIFAGTYDFIESNGDYILNADITESSAQDVFHNIEIIKDYLVNSLDTEFTDNIYLIKHKAVNKRKKGSSWGFNTYPSFAFTGLDFNELVDENGKFSNDNYKYFGHEFAHNYFSNNVMSGTLSWFWLESFPEYLSYNLAEDICGKDFLHSVLLQKAKSLNKSDFIPLDKITDKEQVNNKYRYVLGPLMLKCFEDRFGREATDNVIKLLLQYADTETLTLDHWKKASIKSGISDSDFKEFKAHFISDKQFKKNIISEIKDNYK